MRDPAKMMGTLDQDRVRVVGVGPSAAVFTSRASFGRIHGVNFDGFIEQAAKQALTKGAMTRFVTNFPTRCATKNPRYRVEGQSYRSNIIDLPLETGQN